LIGEVWVTTTDDAAGHVLKDGKAFTLRKAGGAIAGMRWWMPGLFRTLANNMLTTDEPDHSRLRAIVDEAFRRRAILDMEPRISEIAESLAAELFEDGTPADLVDRYARKLPLAVICELLGLPAADRPKFMRWASNITGVRNTVGFLWRMMTGANAIKRYLEAHFESVRVSGGTGLVAELVRAEKDEGRISREELLATVFLLLFAGHETTTHLISGSVYELLRNRPLRDWLEHDWRRECHPGLALGVDASHIRWRPQPGMRAMEKLPVTDRTDAL
jgi:cytochrome P450 PksS